MAIVCTGFTYTYFGEAFPITSLSISADQHAARLAAQELRVQLNASGAWARPVQPGRVASSFKLDQDCQHFVELRGGGNAAFSQMLSGGVYAPFTWRVRHFLPADAAGTVYLLTPSGEPFGFTTTLPEEEEGANLTSAEALSVARLAAADVPWAVDFGVWSLVEEKKEARLRRTDHTFTFERPERVGEVGVDASESQQAKYRLELVVRGARLASLRQSFKVPEAFSREFEGMRSANEAIAQLAWIGIVVLYGVCGVAMGSWLLMRRNALAAASAAPWSVALAGGMGGAMGVQMPLQWMSYATELEVGVFQLDYGVKVAVQSAFFLAIVFLSFVAAEGLGRVAFPNQLRLWALMRRPVLQSRMLLDQVLLGYLLVPVMFAYEVAFYFCCKHLLGWWMPSSPLADPDALATLAPWLPPIAQALFAGFWEEALFRAVPLAATALAAQQRRPITRRVLVGIGFLFQACLFGAAHANYPAQPAYARLVELVLPSVLFGALYWRHGLLPGVIMHYTYDVVWMALPVFLCKTATTDQALVIACALLPLLLVAAARLAPRALPTASEAERLKPRCRPPLCAAPCAASCTPSADRPLHCFCTPCASPSTPPQRPLSNAFAPRLRSLNASWTPAKPRGDDGVPRVIQPPLLAPRAARFSLLGVALLAAWAAWVAGRPAGAHAQCSAWGDALAPSAKVRALALAAAQPATSPGSSDTFGEMLAAEAAALDAADATDPAAAAGALHAAARVRPHSEWAQHRYVWREHRASYAPLVRHGFLRGAAWEVRVARVGENASSAAAAGAEEWLVTHIHPAAGADADADADANADAHCAPAYAPAVVHTLPEGREGAELTPPQAREAARSALLQRGVTVVAGDVESATVAIAAGRGGGGAGLERSWSRWWYGRANDEDTEAAAATASAASEASEAPAGGDGGDGGDGANGLACGTVVETDIAAIAQPQRTDYQFNFTCVDGGVPTAQLDRRIAVRVGAGRSGALLLSLHRFVKVPEGWLRADKTREKVGATLQLATRMLLLLCLVLGAAAGLVAWSAARGADAAALGLTFRRAAAGLLLLAGGGAANRLPQFYFGLRTAQHFTNQLVSHVGSMIVSTAMFVCVYALGAVGVCAPPAAPASVQSRLGLRPSDALRLAAGAGAVVVYHAARTLLNVQTADGGYEPNAVDPSAWFGWSVALGFGLAQMQAFVSRVLLCGLLSRQLHALTPPGRRLGLLASPAAWLLATFAGALALAQDPLGAAPCASLYALPASAPLLGALLLQLQLGLLHDHLQLLPPAVCADALMRLVRTLLHDGSSRVPAAQATAAAVVLGLLALCAQLCASLATPPTKQGTKIA